MPSCAEDASTTALSLQQDFCLPWGKRGPGSKEMWEDWEGRAPEVGVLGWRWVWVAQGPW